MTPEQILQQNLGPMLDGIAAYGRQLADERKLKRDREYQREVRDEERQYQRAVRQDDREYQGAVRDEQRRREDAVSARNRTERKADELESHRLTLQRKVQAAFPDENVAGMTDAQLEAKAVAAEQKLASDSVMAKSETEIRATARTMGIADAATGDIATLRKSVADAKSKEAADAERSRIAAVDQLQEGRLNAPEGKGALEAYNTLAAQKAALLREFAMRSMQGTNEDDPEAKRRIGEKTIAMLATTNPELYGKLAGNPKLKAAVLDRIAIGQMPPTGALDIEQSAILLSINQQASSEVTKEDLASGRLDAIRARSDSYERKAALDAQIKDIDDKINGLIQAFPALRKRPFIDQDVLIGAKPPPDMSPKLPTLPGLPAPAGGVDKGQNVPTGRLPGVSLSAPTAQDVSEMQQFVGAGGGAGSEFAPPPVDGYGSEIDPEKDPYFAVLDAFRSGGASPGGPLTVIPRNVASSAVPLDTMSQYSARAKELTSNPFWWRYDALRVPMDEAIADRLGIRPKQIGLSRFSVPASEIVRRNRDASYDAFSKLPPGVQEQAVIDAINASYNDPNRSRPPFGLQYDSPF